MANLDIAVERDRGGSPLEQSVLMTTDGLESSGFLEHLKLPHYVTFRSMVDRKMTVRAAMQAAAATKQAAAGSSADNGVSPLDDAGDSDGAERHDEAVVGR
jgi:alpha-D-ribose 1-methylphosphonate 5-triphosphate synthase subunit PhnI